MQTQVQKLLLAITLLALVSCSVPGIQQPSIANAQSDKERMTSPSVGAPDRVDLVDGNSMFALNLYQYLKDEAGEANLFYSPYSISAALAMTYAGARGETEQQMADTLHFTLPQEQLHPAFNWLDLALTSRGEGAAGKDDQGFRLNIVNAIWGQSGYKFLDTFLDTLAVNYGAGLRLLEYVVAHELVHRLHPNHSQEFWAYLSRYPKAERARGFILGVAFQQGKDAEDWL